VWTSFAGLSRSAVDGTAVSKLELKLFATWISRFTAVCRLANPRAVLLDWETEPKSLLFVGPMVVPYSQAISLQFGSTMYQLGGSNCRKINYLPRWSRRISNNAVRAVSAGFNCVWMCLFYLSTDNITYLFILAPFLWCSRAAILRAKQESASRPILSASLELDDCWICM
jgi:hypothetical protein